MPLSNSREGLGWGNGKKSENSSQIPEKTKHFVQMYLTNIKGAETQNRRNIAKAMTR